MKEFAVSSGVLPTFALVSMFFATHIGAGSTIGAVERIYTLGIFYGIAYLVNPLFWLITAGIFTKNLERFEGCLSLPDIMNRLYGAPGRWTTVALSIGTCVGVIAVQLSALGYLGSHFFGLSSFYGIIFGCSIICLNMLFGGAKAIVITDMFQFCIFYIAIPSLCAVALSEVGGFQTLVNELPENLIQLNLDSENIWMFLSFILYALLPLADSTFIQRCLMARNSDRLKKALLNTMLVGIPFAFVIFFIALITRVLAPDINPNEAFYYILSTYAPVGMLGLLISGMLAIVMSTANSWLNSAAVICANDIAPMFLGEINKSSKLHIARVSTVIITLLAILLANAHEKVMSIVWLADNFWYPVMFFPIVFGFKGFTKKPKAFVCSMITALICTMIGRIYQGDFDTLSMCFGMLGSFVSFLIYYYYEFNYADMLKRGANSIVNWFVVNKDKTIGYIVSEEQKSNIFIFCSFMIFQYVPSIFESAESGSINYFPIFFIKTVTVVFSIVLFSHEYWNAKFREKYLIAIWSACVFVSLCFSPIYLYLMSYNKVIWVINGVLSLIVLSLFYRSSTIVLNISIASILAYLFYKISGGVPIDTKIASDITIWAISIIFGLMGIILIIASRHIFDSKVTSHSLSARFVAHEVKNSLVSSSMWFNFLDDIITDIKEDKKFVHFKIPQKDWKVFYNSHGAAKKKAEDGIQLVSTVLNLHSKAYRDLKIVSFEELLEKILAKKSLNKISINILENFNFYGSSSAIEIVVENIITNFNKYAGKKALLIISVNAGKVEFKDNGVGISKDVLENIFSSSATTAGYGLGMALSKKIVQEHGGDISCDSEVTKYANFVITLPVT